MPDVCNFESFRKKLGGNGLGILECTYLEKAEKNVLYRVQTNHRYQQSASITGSEKILLLRLLELLSLVYRLPLSPKPAWAVQAEFVVRLVIEVNYDDKSKEQIPDIEATCPTNRGNSSSWDPQHEFQLWRFLLSSFSLKRKNSSEKRKLTTIESGYRRRIPCFGAVNKEESMISSRSIHQTYGVTGAHAKYRRISFSCAQDARRDFGPSAFPTRAVCSGGRRGAAQDRDVRGWCYQRRTLDTTAFTKQQIPNVIGIEIQKMKELFALDFVQIRTMISSGIKIKSWTENRIDDGNRITIISGTGIKNGTGVENECGVGIRNKSVTGIETGSKTCLDIDID
ncbi:hypothetical protein EVAR_81482_1 [Eumeta japonica]|uniref:Uncharacterized protein n=1 Tax=Eumeta variegata TaxID=151549 RepID=A0A4C1W3G6_EUMVA|nr:hypothetical protein EVAR_81482_1 [Eumeta japonica]